MCIKRWEDQRLATQGHLVADGCSLEKTEPSALQLSHVLINAFSSAPSISIVGVVGCYGREVGASRLAGNLELRGFIWLLQVKGSE